MGCRLFPIERCVLLDSPGGSPLARASPLSAGRQHASPHPTIRSIRLRGLLRSEIESEVSDLPVIFQVFPLFASGHRNQGLGLPCSGSLA